MSPYKDGTGVGAEGIYKGTPVPSPRIVGGQDADQGEYPYQVLVLPSGSLCGGALIDAEWVLTAAHCLFSGSTQLSPSDVNVKLGDHNIYSTDGTEQSISVSQVIPHPNYDPNTTDNDIALLKLSSPANLITGQVEVISLNQSGTLADGTLATVTGWGTTSEGGSIASILQEVNVPLVSNATCNNSYGSITDNMLCAGYAAGGKDACQGDSGGPLVVPDGNGGFVHAGVVSFGNGCARANYYGVYARTSRYIEWIGQYVTLTDNTPSPNPTNTPTPLPTATATPPPISEDILTPSDNLISDGNFDEGSNVWQEDSSNSYNLIGSFDDVPSFDIDPVSPPSLAWLGGADNEESSISREMELPLIQSEVGTLILSYQYQIESTDSCGYDTGHVAVDGINLISYNLCSDENTNAWVEGELDLNGYEGETVEVSFRVSTDSSNTSSFVLDDISLILTDTYNPNLEERAYMPFMWD
ncbi:MAG: serine protease [Chloroflexota bacterium]